MKKMILLATICVAGLVSAKSTEVRTETKEVNASSAAMFFYHPITLTSSCGYTQTVEVGANDAPDCYLTDLQQMEDECSAPFTNPIMAGMW
ncbi:MULTISPECIES: hypothetical protein [unclassified Chryseobacterium]|uniref:hypothetical protein n=1 Tax=unclassified Chryseobacterium TaxID=2593645 RepID=UPI001AE4508C|nr:MULTISPECIES: hypothetical protein [unclassified Chryseobacterium]MBP1163761.1 hypothetical protein [Chryseobacterium sp. PvR013]MDR4894082.1 hypothetical protein [Chryseobacterium sp. CFS7]